MVSALAQGVAPVLVVDGEFSSQARWTHSPSGSMAWYRLVLITRHAKAEPSVAIKTGHVLPTGTGLCLIKRGAPNGISNQCRRLESPAGRRFRGPAGHDSGITRIWSAPGQCEQPQGRTMITLGSTLMSPITRFLMTVTSSMSTLATSRSLAMSLSSLLFAT